VYALITTNLEKGGGKAREGGGREGGREGILVGSDREPEWASEAVK